MPSSTLWRVRMLQQQGEAFNTYALAEIRLYDAAGSQISTAGASFAVSATWGNPASNLFDGNPATYWEGRSDTTGNIAWAEITFGSPVDVATFGVTTKNATGGAVPVLYDLQYYNGSIWVTTFAPKILNGLGTSQVRDFLPGMRIYQVYTTAGNAGYIGADEIEFRAVAGVPLVASSLPGWAVGNTTYGGSEVPDNAFDGNTGTWWTGPTVNPATIEYWFETSFDAVELYYNPRDGYPEATPLDFSVRYSDDWGQSFTTMASFTGEAWTATPRTFVIGTPPPPGGRRRAVMLGSI